MILTHVIDGDAATRLVARRVLEKAGFTVTEAANGALPAPGCPDLIVVDLQLASLATLRRRHPAAKLLALVGAPGAAPLTGRLGKPFTPSQLLAAVRLCLAQPGATAAARQRSARPPRRPA